MPMDGFESVLLRRKPWQISDESMVSLRMSLSSWLSSELPRLALFSILSIVEGGVCFPLHPMLQDFLAQTCICPLQLLTRAYRIISSAIAMSSKIGARFGISEILEHCSFMDSSRGLYYFRAKLDKPDLFQFLVDKNDHDQDFLLVGGNWEYGTGAQVPIKRVGVKPGAQGLSTQYYVFLPQPVVNLDN